MTNYVVYGAGTPIYIESYSPEVAEAEVVLLYSVPIDNLITMEEQDELLSGTGDRHTIEEY
jgi:hypothetical protein